jgi:death-on-curing protein
MATPSFLDLDHVMRLHSNLIEHYGGIYEMADAYMHHLVQNHPFLDGNKRIGAASTLVFLAINDINIANDEDGLVELTISVATGQAGKSEIAEFFRSHVE